MLDWLEGKSKSVLAIVALLSAITSAGFALDARYLHSEVAEMLRKQDKHANDIIHTEIHLTVVSRAMKYYEKLLDSEGYNPTEAEKREYGVLKDTVRRLEDKQNKAMGLP
jgi:hypothetical protein